MQRVSALHLVNFWSLYSSFCFCFRSCPSKYSLKSAIISFASLIEISLLDKGRIWGGGSLLNLRPKKYNKRIIVDAKCWLIKKVSTLLLPDPLKLQVFWRTNPLSQPGTSGESTRVNNLLIKSILFWSFKVCYTQSHWEGYSFFFVTNFYIIQNGNAVLDLDYFIV